jgi:hypothetical protein
LNIFMFRDYRRVQRCIQPIAFVFWISCLVSLAWCEVSKGMYFWAFEGEQELDFPEPRSGHSLVGSEYPILFGGLSNTGPLNDTYRFFENTWIPIVTTGEGPAPRSEHSAGLIDDTMIVFGGWGRTEQFSTDCAQLAASDQPCLLLGAEEKVFAGTHILNISSSSWTMLSATLSEPAPRRGACSVVVGGRLYLFGGHASTRQDRPEPSSFMPGQLHW